MSTYFIGREIDRLLRLVKEQEKEIARLREKLADNGLSPEADPTREEMKVLERPIKDYGFSIRVTNRLEWAGILTIGDIQRHPRSFYTTLKGFGRTSPQEMDIFMEKLELSYAPEPEDS